MAAPGRPLPKIGMLTQRYEIWDSAVTKAAIVLVRSDPARWNRLSFRFHKFPCPQESTTVCG
jgi:hypothetical protein